MAMAIVVDEVKLRKLIRGIWKGMIQRCTNPKRDAFIYYGGRGIEVCQRWLDSFENFLADVEPRPSPAHSIDRFPNPNGNYEPGNVRWATRAEQSRNKKNNHLMTLNGETHCLTEWAEVLGYSRGCLKERIRRGLPLDRVLSAEPLSSQWKSRKRNLQQKG